MSLVARGLNRVIDGVPHLDSIDLDLQPGRIYAVIGRTGAGKTSLLRALAGLDSLDSGELTHDGEDLLRVPVWKRDTAMVYQQFINYPHMSVLQNVVFPLRRAGLGAAEARERATAALEKVGLADFFARRPSQLSGGQQQRVALARALARRTRVLLLDEPLVNLDYKLREQLREEFRDLFSGVGDAVVVYTTTEPAEAMSLGDEVIVLHQGRVVQSGAPGEVFDRPRTAEVAAVINDPPMNIAPASVVDGELVLAGMEPRPLPGHLGALPEGRYLLGLRATDLALGSPGGSPAEVTFEEISGSETAVHVAAGSVPFVIQLEGIHNVSIGESVRISPNFERLFAFDADGDLLVAPPQEGN